MYFARALPSRTWAPRSVYRLCSVPVQFSATHSARRSGIHVFISAGASVPGVSWNCMRTPSMVSHSPDVATSYVGRMKLVFPADCPLPMPMASDPCGPLSR